jgi:hypothetical protein
MITLEWLLLQRMFYIQLVLNVIHIIIFALPLSFLLLLPHRYIPIRWEGLLFFFKGGFQDSEPHFPKGVFRIRNMI